MDRQLIEEAKDAVSLLEYLEDEGVELTGDDPDRKYCKCPFHDDEKPSMMVTHRFAVCYASTCGWCGDILDWVQTAQDIDFTSALRWLCDKAGIKWEQPGSRDLDALAAHQKQSSFMAVLEAVAKHYHTAFVPDFERSPGYQYALDRGISSEVALKFKLGWCPADHDTMGMLVEDGYKPDLVREAKLVQGKKSDYPRLAGKLVVPVRWWGKVVNLYGRRIDEDDTDSLKHDYILRHRMCFGWDECRRDKRVRNSHVLFAAEGIIDALVLWSAGIPAVALYGTKALRAHWARRIKRAGIHTLVYVPDADGDDGKIAALKVAATFMAAGVKVLVAPVADGYDPAALGQESYPRLKSVVRKAVTDRITAYEYAQEHDLLDEKTPSLLRLDDQRRLHLDCSAYEIVVHSYRHTRDGLSAVVSLYVEGIERFRDKLNTWAARSRSTFVKQAGLKAGVAVEASHRLMLLDEEIRRHDRWDPSDPDDETLDQEIDEELRDKAVQLLQSPDLVKTLSRDITRMGFVGEPRAKVLMYLVATGRLMQDPLHCCVMSQSSTGKSALVDAIVKLMPEESVCMMSAMSSRALYHLDENALMHRWVIMAERSGYDEIANHAVRLLQSEGMLRYMVAMKDEQTGGIETEEKLINGPMAWTETTTEQENELNPENLNRMIVIYLDESAQQTGRIHEYQRKMAKEQAVAADTARQKIAEVHQAAQRLLKPGLKVVVPFSDLLKFPSQFVRARRDFQKVLGLINASAILHQFQRRQGVVHGVDVLYAEPFDYRIAYGLYSALLQQAYTGLPKKAEEILHIIGKSVVAHAKSRKIRDATSITFKRRDIIEWSQWSARAVAKAIEPLEEQEILEARYDGGRGNPAIYTLTASWNGYGSGHVSGMVHPSKLERQWKKLQEQGAS